MHNLSLVWLRRNLRLEDNKPMASAIANSHKIQPIFIFDKLILERFTNPNDRRLSFLMATLFGINKQLTKKGGKLLVFYGNSTSIIARIASSIRASAVYADQDFEPENIKRDRIIEDQLSGICQLKLLCDHLLFHPDHITNKGGKPFKVYTPYMKVFRAALRDETIKEATYSFTNKLYQSAFDSSNNTDYQVVNLDSGIENALKQIGYNYQKDSVWSVENPKKYLEDFVHKKINTYAYNRDFLYKEGTSSLSPYIRFGLISIRECYRQAFREENAEKWINELIWREFYATILYHFPHTQNLEFQPKFQNTLPWRQDSELLERFYLGKTGFPIVDAAVRQLLTDGWMHNRARLIVASFFSKNLFLDWRLGEEFFAQHLMDYDLSSNVGGWQWASSCGTDAQPFFRAFNPITQGQKFDFGAEYVKKYVPELENAPSKLIHNQKAVENNFAGKYNYPAPIVDYKESRDYSLAIFRSIKAVKT